MATNDSVNKVQEGTTTPLWKYAVFLMFCALIVAMFFFSQFAIVDGNIVANTPYPTVTPSDFDLVVKIIQEPQIAGSEIAEYETWLVVKALEDQRMVQKGKPYNLILPQKARSEVGLNQKLKLTCT